MELHYIQTGRWHSTDRGQVCSAIPYNCMVRHTILMIVWCGADNILNSHDICIVKYIAYPPVCQDLFQQKNSFFQ